MARDTDANDAPTATEFIPAEENGVRDDQGPGIRILQSTGDGGLEIVDEQPYGDTVENHVYVCDECGHDEWEQPSMGKHLEHNH